MNQGSKGEDAIVIEGKVNPFGYVFLLMFVFCFTALIFQVVRLFSSENIHILNWIFVSAVIIVLAVLSAPKAQVALTKVTVTNESLEFKRFGLPDSTINWNSVKKLELSNNRRGAIICKIVDDVNHTICFTTDKLSGSLTEEEALERFGIRGFPLYNFLVKKQEELFGQSPP